MPGPAPFTIPQGTVMWGGGGGIPKAPLGTYTVKVSMGSWSQSQTFRRRVHNVDPPQRFNSCLAIPREIYLFSEELKRLAELDRASG